ncbi:flagellar biosynthesis protein FlaG [Asticcacaulis machinosus]|uniref:Flagellar biosynthesis protein FlaG n=1 Tax=Asticcacaulis machinosus TaxID=2984211 RepID=A0ABT5HFS3_9CAUL|nr:flagellar biosynthesis protein FlaG [Asticcacaulis machinosus]MDC7675103.1 flagellar biosynthesis protein FlaG [Asticcacaulis machinosus]
MINNVSGVPQVSDVTPVRAVPDVPKELPNTVKAGAGKGSADNNGSPKGSKSEQAAKPLAYQLKLVVEIDPDTGDFVYKAINRVTGQVVSQLPRKELLDMKHDANYRAGSVIKTDI